MKSWIVISLLSFFLLCCGISMGNRIDNGNLSVYFLEGIPNEKAIAFSRYWQEQGYVGDRKQVIQLEKGEHNIVVKIIEREMFQEDGLTITEESMIQQIERNLKRDIFNQEVEVMITDNTFRPILKR